MSQIDQISLISIVIPSFNQGIFLERTIRSILIQDYPNIELIIVDNCSSDSTPKLLAEYKSLIDIIVVEPDEGQSDAINKGFSLASGDYLTWLNSDDFYYSPQAISSVMNTFFENPSVDFVYGDIFLYFHGRKPIPLHGKHYCFRRDFQRLEVPIPQQGSVLRKSIFDDGISLDCDLHYLLDRDFFLRIASTYSIRYVNLPLACFRQHPEAKSFASIDRWIDEYLNLYFFYYSAESPFQSLPPFKSTFTAVYLQVSLLYLRAHNFHGFIRYVFKSFLLWDFQSFFTFLYSKIHRNLFTQ